MFGEGQPPSEMPKEIGPIVRTRNLVSNAVNRFLDTPMESPLSGPTTRRELWQGVVTQPLGVAVAPATFVALIDGGARALGFIDQSAPRPSPRTYAEAAAIGLAYSVPVGALAAVDVPTTEVAHLARRVRDMLPGRRNVPPPTSQGQA